MTSNNKSFAETMHEQATMLTNEQATVESISIRDQVKFLVQNEAKKGKLLLKLPLQDRNWSKEALDIAIEQLITLDNLSVKKENEITAQYSNTDWDSENFLYVRW